MISFIKFLKVVLPIVSVTTATLTTVSLISHKKHDPDAQEKPKEINLSSFVSLNEDFKEKLMLYSKDGKGENVSFEDAEKAKKILENLKENGSLGELPEFENPQQLAEFLEKLPEGIMNDLLNDSNLSKEDLSKLDPNTLSNLGRFGEKLRSQQQQQQQMHGDVGDQITSQINQPNLNIENPPKSPNISGIDNLNTEENLGTIDELYEKALDKARSFQNSDLAQNLEDLATNPTLQDAAEQLTDTLSSNIPNTSVSLPDTSKLQVPDINLSFEGSEAGMTKDNKGDLTDDQNVDPNVKDGENPGLSDKVSESHDERVGDEGADISQELKNSKLEDDEVKLEGIPPVSEARSSDSSAPSESSELPPQEPHKVDLEGKDNDQSTSHNSGSSHSLDEAGSIQPISPADSIDLKLPMPPDIELPDVPFDLGSLKNLLDAIPDFGGEGNGVSLTELKGLAVKLAQTSNSLGNLILKS